MATTAQAPQIDSVSWAPNGDVRVVWTNRPGGTSADHYQRVMVYVRDGGRWREAASFGYPAINNQVYYISGFKLQLSHEIAMRAETVSNGLTGFSSSVQLAAVETPTPTFTDIIRTGASTARVLLVQNGAAPASVEYTNLWGRQTSLATLKVLGRTSNGTQAQFDVSGLDGAATYETFLASWGPAGSSRQSQSRTLPAWWESPSAPQDLAGSRAAGGAVSLSWSGSPSARAPWNTIRVRRREGTTGSFAQVASLPGSARSWTDSTASPTRAYSYEVEVVSPAGTAKASTSSFGPTVDVPNPPSNVTAEYAATNKVAVSWTRNPSEERAYTGQQVGVRDVSGSDGPWTWTSVSATATEATVDVGVNRRVEVTVRASNAAGVSEVAEPAGPVVTTPAAPQSLSAQWDGDGSAIRVTIPAYATVGDRLVLEFSTDGAVWFPAASLATSVRSWLHTGVTPAVPHYYRAWVESDADGTPDSATVMAGTVPALTRPAPPTLSVPEVVDATEAVQVPVRHNTLDGSGQTAGEFRHRLPGGEWTVSSIGELPFGIIPAGTYSNGATVEVSARTAGAAGELSEWSTPLQLVLRARPVVTLTGPGAVVESGDVTVTWTASAQAAATVDLLDPAGALLDTVEVGAADRAATFTGLHDGAAYRVRVVATDQWQASLPVTRDFTVDLESPDMPAVRAWFDVADATVTVAATQGPDATTTDMQLWRNLGAGWEPVGGRVDVNEAGEVWLTDPLPRLVATDYRVRAWNELGGWTDSVTATVTPPDDFCHFILDHPGGQARATWNPSIQLQAGRTTTLRRYVGDDSPSPVFGSALPYVIEASFALHPLEADTPLLEWERLAEAGGPMTWRDPAGRVMPGVLTGFSGDGSAAHRQTISFTFTRTI